MWHTHFPTGMPPRLPGNQSPACCRHVCPPPNTHTHNVNQASARACLPCQMALATLHVAQYYGVPRLVQESERTLAGILLQKRAASDTQEGESAWGPCWTLLL